MDPNKKEREEEEKLRKEVKASKKHWRVIRKERFGFLDVNTGTTKGGGGKSFNNTTSRGNEEKKVNDTPKALAL